MPEDSDNFQNSKSDLLAGILRVTTDGRVSNVANKIVGRESPEWHSLWEVITLETLTLCSVVENK